MHISPLHLFGTVLIVFRMSEKAQQYLINFIVAAIMAVAPFLIYMLATMNWTLMGLCNGFTLGAIVCLLGFLLYLVTRLGAFDMFAYGFKDIFFHMNPNKDKVKKYDDYADYLEKKKEERSRSRVCFIPYVVVGGAFLVTALALRLSIFYTSGF